MPELPEVETVKNQISTIIGSEISNVIISDKKLKNGVPHSVKLAINNKIINITRKGKYLLFHLSNGYIIGHLGMTGKFYLTPEKKEDKHAHVSLELNNDNKVFYLTYVDARRFGFMDYVKTPQEHKSYNSLGEDALLISGAELFKLKDNQKIKSFLLDQHKISGIGNIYADEILFVTKVLPTSISKTLSLETFTHIIKESKKILLQSIKNGGSTIQSYTSVNGQKGNNQMSLKVYGRAGKPCLFCSTKLSSDVIGGRSTVFCSTCQK